MRGIFLIGAMLPLLVSGAHANAASPLSASETAGLQHYCSVMYDLHGFPAPQKEDYCACFMQEASTLSPVIRQMVILLGDDPDSGPATRRKMQQLAAPYNAEQQRTFIAEMNHFASSVPPKCLQKALGK